MSIQKIAEATGISPGYLSEVERGHSAVSGEKLARLASALGVSVDYLLSGGSEPSAAPSIAIPHGLAEAAEELDLSYTQTVRLLAGKTSLVARRSSGREEEWSKKEWIDFYETVKPWL
jgi:transcriptional regulator with XRE-family HTH domain